MLAKCLVGEPRADGELVAGVEHDDLDALVAQDPEPAAAGLRARIVGGDDDRAIPAARIASVHGGVLPLWQHGSSET